MVRWIEDGNKTFELHYGECRIQQYLSKRVHKVFSAHHASTMMNCNVFFPTFPLTQRLRDFPPILHMKLS